VTERREFSLELTFFRPRPKCPIMGHLQPCSEIYVKNYSVEKKQVIGLGR